MDYKTIIQMKMEKVEGSLMELHNEISVATKYLLKLKENTAAVVRNLNSITAPSTYLEEFLNVNLFLLQSISFLAEFNCKFEILGINEKTPSNWVLSNKSQTPVVKTQIAEELKSSESGKVLKGDIIEQQPKVNVSDSQHFRNESKTKSKCQKSKSLLFNNKKTNKNCPAKGTAAYVKSRVKKNNDIKINDRSSTSEAEERSNSGVRDVSEDMVPIEKVNTEETHEENKSSSEAYLQRESTEINHDNKQISNESSHSSFTDDLHNTYANNIVCTTVQSPGSIPVAEVVPTKKIGEMEESEDFNHAQDPKEDIAKSSQPTIESDDELDDIKCIDRVRKVGEEYDVIVEYIKSPSEFYVSISDNNKANQLMELENKLKNIPANKNVSCKTRNELSKTMLSREIGRYCLVYSKCDETWCRAKVTNWCLNYEDDFVNVFLLDYGESKCVSIYDLQALPKHLKQYPPFTIRCHLHDVFPLEMDKSNDILSWGKESSEEMRSLTEDSKNVKMRVEPNDSFHADTSLPVTLWLVDQGNKCINELLVSGKFAIHGPVFEETEKKTEKGDDHLDGIVDDDVEEETNSLLTDWDPMKEDYESYKNSYDLDANDPSAIIYGYVGRDYDRICKHFANTGHCYKGLACRKEHKKLDHLGFTTDQEEVFQSAINNLQVPPPQSRVNVQVTCLLACNKFFCFMESQNASSQEEDLQSLLQFINKKENVIVMKKLLIPPSAGQVVLARYSEDKAWYRARVLESQPENDQYTVLFVDYGNSETLHLSDIRAIEPRYLHLPFQAMQCCIFGIEQNPEVPLEEVMGYMKTRINDGHLSIEVISRLPGDNINLLVNVFDRKGVNIGKDLISKKYAVDKEEMVINSASESIPG